VLNNKRQRLKNSAANYFKRLKLISIKVCILAAFSLSLRKFFTKKLPTKQKKSLKKVISPYLGEKI